MPREVIIPEDVIRELYVTKQLPIHEIAKRLNRGQATVLRYLRIYGVEIRPRGHWKGVPLRSETRNKLREFNIGKVVSEETKRKLSIAGMGKKKGRPNRIVNDKGYVLLWMPDNPMSNKVGYVAEHRYVMSNSIGRPLDRDELIHHRNGIKSDNRIENLQITTRVEHQKLHTNIRCPNCSHEFIYTMGC